MSANLITNFEIALKLAGSTAQWCDDTSLGTLVILAFVLRAVAQKLPQPEANAAPPIISGVFLLAYFFHRYLLDGDQFECLFWSVIRSFIAAHLVWSIIHLAILVVQWLVLQLAKLRYFLYGKAFALRSRVEKTRENFRRWQEGKHPPPKPVPQPPVTPAARLRQRAEAAQAEYEAEIAALAGVPLDEDEREMLLALAKQRLIGHLNFGEQHHGK